MRAHIDLPGAFYLSIPAEPWTGDLFTREVYPLGEECIAILLAAPAWAQTLPKDTEIKVRTDSAIPAKPAANKKYAASISNDINDSSGNVVIPRGSRA